MSKKSGPGSSKSEALSKTLKASREVALIGCRGCLGTLVYADTRRKRLEDVVSSIFTGYKAAKEPLALTVRDMLYKNLSTEKWRVHGLGDYL